MARSVEDWADDFQDRPFKTSAKFGVRAIVVCTVCVIAALACTAVVWGLMTGGSYWWGQAGATQQKNSSQNFIDAQARFHNDQNAVTADQAKIVDAKAAIAQFDAAHPGYQGNGTPYDPLAQQETNLQTTLTGLQQGCQNEVTDYNDAAQGFLTADWRDAGLPEELSLSSCE